MTARTRMMVARNLVMQTPFVAGIARRMLYLAWPWQMRILDSFTNMDAFLAYVRKVQPRKFLQYQAMSSEKRKQFDTMMAWLQMDLRGLSVLDLGPGYGDSLDICHERNAKTVDFVEWEPFFYTYNRLKRFGEAYRINLLVDLEKLDSHKYDLIWAKGCFSADNFNDRRSLRHLAHWLELVERICSSSRRIVICPHWHNDGQKRKIANVQGHLFSQMLFAHGYTAVRLPGHNGEPQYPITFVKEVRCGALARPRHESRPAPCM